LLLIYHSDIFATLENYFKKLLDCGIFATLT